MYIYIVNMYCGLQCKCIICIVYSTETMSKQENFVPTSQGITKPKNKSIGFPWTNAYPWACTRVFRVIEKEREKKYTMPKVCLINLKSIHAHAAGAAAAVFICSMQHTYVNM